MYKYHYVVGSFQNIFAGHVRCARNQKIKIVLLTTLRVYGYAHGHFVLLLWTVAVPVFEAEVHFFAYTTLQCLYVQSVLKIKAIKRRLKTYFHYL
jgi:hypothetical protein